MEISKKELEDIIKTISDNAFNLGLTYAVMGATPEENVKILKQYQNNAIKTLLEVYENQ